ncbi:1-phosphatidylinositol 4,5-bisphosphate phosphodiesterase delta-1-like [Oopsacas minuta]|uniref:Phosphoinositide phospholipase C n=1 Tax=Oopsacas minuta TaxID=111878 RepID=A0AAV7JFZ5_9METZ|nr:1-phosphatidylinositol 4,5-bisphosphate phosphodiesterase delta-1-like [Oopsacas minuta]
MRWDHGSNCVSLESSNYAHPGNVWERSDFLIFLKSSQKCADIDESMVDELIDKYEPTGVKSEHRLSLDGLTNFLLDPKQFVYDHRHREVHQDMSLPLSHYFIASSHNTYLLEDQIRGPSSVEGYIRSLRSGCRCVEMDVWDGPTGSPILYHGHTFTSKISLEDVLKAVDEHAFVCSPYPVLISIENHCSIDQQTTMAHMFQSIFGEKLYIGAVDETLDDLPSPESFLNKILIKGKKLKDETDIGDVSDEDEASELVTPEEIKRQVKKQENDQASKSPPSADQGSQGATAPQRSSGSSVPTKIDSGSHNKKIKLSVKLSKVVNYIQASHFKGLDKSLNHETKYYTMSSFSEPKVESLMSKEGWKFVEYNKRQISRIYPKGSRIDSSNYNPVPMWYHGSQIVALNYQTNGEIMDINNGFFNQNGRSGYIKKPACLRERFLAYDPSSTNTRGVPGVIGRKYTIVAISGQQLPKPSSSTRRSEVIDPYVQFTVYGPGMNNLTFKTKMIYDNGFNPNWNETFTFEAKFPEVSLVRIVVFDYDRLSEDDFIGQFTVPINCLMPGYRHVPLLTKEGNIIEFASVFLHITVEDERINFKRTEDYRAQNRKISRNIPRELATLLVDIEGLMVNSFTLFDNFYHSFSELRKSLGLNQEASIIQCLKSIYSRDPNMKIRLTKTETNEYLIETEIGDKLESNRSINLLRELVNQCDRVSSLSPQMLTALEKATHNCRNVLRLNAKVLNSTIGSSYKLFDMAMVVGSVWTQETRLKETCVEVQLTLDLVSNFIYIYIYLTFIYLSYSTSYDTPINGCQSDPVWA